MDTAVYTIEEAARKLGMPSKDITDAIIGGILHAMYSQNIGAYLIKHEDLMGYTKLTKRDAALEQGTKKKVLVIDDELRFAELVKLQLNIDRRVEVKIATNGKDGLRYIEQFRPDLLLLDFMLPDLTGDQVLHALSRQKTVKPKVIVYSAHTREIVQKMPDLEQRLQSLGADDFFSKQDGTKPLLRRVYELLGLDAGTRVIKKPS